jgi:hypothetical protein
VLFEQGAVEALDEAIAYARNPRNPDLVADGADDGSSYPK